MKYVNPKLFKNFDDIKGNTEVAGDFVWLLLAGDNSVPVTAVDEDNELKIYKESVVGFATVDGNLLTMEQTGVDTVSLTIPGSGSTGNILYMVGAQSTEEGLQAKALALVKTNCIFAEAGNVTEDIVSIFKEGYYSYTDPKDSELSGAFTPDLKDSSLANTTFDNDDIIVIAAYSVTSNSTAINNYNFSGFTVSDSNVKISGLYTDL